LNFRALRYALGQELFINGSKLLFWEKEQESVLERFLGPIFFPSKKHKQSERYRYLGYIEIGERIVYYWWVLENPKTKDLVSDRLFAIRTYQTHQTYQERQEIDPEKDILRIMTSPDGSITSEYIENPLTKIQTKEMTLKELTASGEHGLPPPLMRELEYLQTREDVFEPWDELHYYAEVSVPLLGIKLVPESDIEFVDVEVIDHYEGIIEFHYNRKYYRSRKED
jgi:hypothetical protein